MKPHLALPLPPFGLQKDGDLWEIFYDNVKQRGPDSIRFSWVKGHASLSDAATATERAHQAGNNKADALATKGREELFDPNVVFLSKHLFFRHQQAVQFYSLVHLVLVRVYLAAQALRKNKSYPSFPECSLGVVGDYLWVGTRMLVTNGNSRWHRGIMCLYLAQSFTLHL